MILFHFMLKMLNFLELLILKFSSSDKRSLFPNLRKLHKNIYLNILQKIFFQNFIIRNLLSTKYFKKLFRYKILKIKPGNLYMFFGFNSLHGNLEIEETSTRATLLIHAYDVFEDSKLVKINRDKSIKKEIKNIKV